MHTPRLAHQVHFFLLLFSNLLFQIIMYTSAVISLIGNGFLIVLALHRDSRVLGSYSALLIAFAVMDITVSVVHAYLLPVSLALTPHVYKTVVRSFIKSNMVFYLWTLTCSTYHPTMRWLWTRWRYAYRSHHFRCSPAISSTDISRSPSEWG